MRVTYVLPESVEAPVSGNLTSRGGVSSEDKRALLAKGSAVACASLPPISSGVDKRVLGSSSLVGLDKVGDPVDHGTGRETVAGSAAGVVLNVEHTGEGDAVTAPATTVLEEVVGLSSARRRGGLGKVVTTTDQAGVGGIGVLLAESGRFVASALSSLDDDETGAISIGLGHVDVGLVSRDCGC